MAPVYSPQCWWMFLWQFQYFSVVGEGERAHSQGNMVTAVNCPSPDNACSCLRLSFSERLSLTPRPAFIKTGSWPTCFRFTWLFDPSAAAYLNRYLYTQVHSSTNHNSQTYKQPKGLSQMNGWIHSKYAVCILHILLYVSVCTMAYSPVANGRKTW